MNWDKASLRPQGISTGPRIPYGHQGYKSPVALKHIKLIIDAGGQRPCILGMADNARICNKPGLYSKIMASAVFYWGLGTLYLSWTTIKAELEGRVIESPHYFLATQQPSTPGASTLRVLHNDVCCTTIGLP